MSEKYQRFSVSLPKSLLEEFDTILKTLGMTRSDAIRKAMRDYITLTRELLTPKKGFLVGSITFILDHEQRHGIMDQLNELQHHHLEVTNTALHIHLDQRNCMIVLPVRGNAKDIKELNLELQAMPEIKDTKLTLIAAGEEF